MTRVYVGGLPADIRPDDVMYEFRRYEPLRVDLKQGFGFLEFREPRDADDAVHDMDGHKVGGRPIAVQFARGAQRRDFGSAGGAGGPRGGGYEDRGRGGGFGGPPSSFGGSGMKKGSGYQVEVEGLDSRTSWQDLKDFARGAGNVQFADVFIRHGKVSQPHNRTQQWRLAACLPSHWTAAVRLHSLGAVRLCVPSLTQKIGYDPPHTHRLYCSHVGLLLAGWD